MELDLPRDLGTVRVIPGTYKQNSAVATMPWPSMTLPQIRGYPHHFRDWIFSQRMLILQPWLMVGAALL